MPGASIRVPCRTVPYEDLHRTEIHAGSHKEDEKGRGIYKMWRGLPVKPGWSESLTKS